AIDRTLAEGDLLGGPAYRHRIWNELPQERLHPLVRLDRNHPSEAVDEQPRQLPGPGGEVEHVRARPKPEPRGDAVEDLVRPSGPPELVLLGRAPECVRG